MGCEDLRAHLPRIRPRLHVAGHIHEARGAHIHTWDPQHDDQPPLIQYEATINDESDMEDLGIRLEEEEENSEQGVPSSCSSDEPAERTVFVNAANWPSGPRAHSRGDGKVPFGGPGFQPIVVDLKE